MINSYKEPANLRKLPFKSDMRINVQTRQGHKPVLAYDTSVYTFRHFRVYI